MVSNVVQGTAGGFLPCLDILGAFFFFLWHCSLVPETSLALKNKRGLIVAIIYYLFQSHTITL